MLTPNFISASSRLWNCLRVRLSEVWTSLHVRIQLQACSLASTSTELNFSASPFPRKVRLSKRFECSESK